MGQMLIACGEAMDGIEIVAGVDEGDDLSALIADCDVVIDFSLHSATAAAKGIRIGRWTWFDHVESMDAVYLIHGATLLVNLLHDHANCRTTFDPSREKCQNQMSHPELNRYHDHR